MQPSKSISQSLNKWKDSVEGSLDRVLFAAELELAKILVPRLPQHTSEWAEQPYYLYVTSFLEH